MQTKAQKNNRNGRHAAALLERSQRAENVAKEGKKIAEPVEKDVNESSVMEYLRLGTLGQQHGQEPITTVDVSTILSTFFNSTKISTVASSCDDQTLEIHKNEQKECKYLC